MTATRPRPPRAADGDRGRGRRAARRARRVVFGDERRLGLWLLPLFLITALLGATLAGGLAVLYYAQQVADLERTTATARAALDEAVERVNTTSEEATNVIEDQVRRFREQLAQDLPITSPNESGIYALSAQHENGAVRVASGFVVFSDDSETFVVTTYGLVATDDGFAVERADVLLPGQTVRGRVHNFDPELDLAVVVLTGGPLPVLEWRPAEEDVALGDAIYHGAIAGPDTPVVAEGRIAAASASAVVPTFPVNGFTGGGPLLDPSGRVVAIATPDHLPFGPTEGGVVYAVPIRALCQALVRCTESDLGTDSLGDPSDFGPDPTDPAPGAEAQPGATPTPPPDGEPTPPPEDEPSPDPEG